VAHRGSQTKAQTLRLWGLLILLGAVAWVVGWGTRALFDNQNVTLPAGPGEPTISLPEAITPLTSVPTISPTLAVGSPTNNSVPTSTPAPTLTPSPTEEWETVQAGDGLYQVCRRHCLDRWPNNDVPQDLEEYARQVAELNGLHWPNPDVYPDQGLRMPPCP
jgi:hypothetical protein